MKQPEFVFDYDLKTRKIRLLPCNEFDIIRCFFSREIVTKNSFRFGRRKPNIREFIIGQSGLFPFPFLPEVQKFCKQQFPFVEQTFTDILAQKLESTKCDESALKKVDLKFGLRDYQEVCVSKLLATSRGLGILPTSAGKTLVCCSLISTLLIRDPEQFKKALVIVPSIQLVDQTADDFNDYFAGTVDLACGKWSGSHEIEDNPITVANSSNILAKMRLSPDETKQFLKQFDIIVVDEVHKIASAQAIRDVLLDLSPKRLYGVTGSLPKEEFLQWKINTIFGQVVYTKPIEELKEDKYVSECHVCVLKLNHAKMPALPQPSRRMSTEAFRAELEYLLANEFRNDTICRVVNRVLPKNTLLLVDRVEHCETLYAMLKDRVSDSDKKVHMVHGKIPSEDRELVRKIMEEHDGAVCVAMSSIFSTGISINNLHNVILCSPGKARIRLIQSIGRSLRLHKHKDTAYIFDVTDLDFYYSEKHFAERLEVYREQKIPLFYKQINEQGLLTN